MGLISDILNCPRDEGVDILRATCAEFLAMFMFIFASVGAAISTGGQELMAAFEFGFMIFVLVHIFGHVSGANINPAVTLALLVAGKLHWLKGVCYWVAQFSASIAAAAVLRGTMGPRLSGVSNFRKEKIWTVGTEDLEKYSAGAAFVGEFIMTSLLIVAVFATIDSGRTDPWLGPLAIGISVTCAHLILIPMTNCSINPARSLGTAVFSRLGEGPNSASQNFVWDDIWIFFVAPLCAAVVAGLVYKYFFSVDKVTQGTTKQQAADDLSEKLLE